MYFSAINGAALDFGVLFIIQAIVWLLFGVIRPKLAFQFHTNPYALTGIVRSSWRWRARCAGWRSLRNHVGEDALLQRFWSGDINDDS
jgi:hypothetical protein